MNLNEWRIKLRFYKMKDLLMVKIKKRCIRIKDWTRVYNNQGWNFVLEEWKLELGSIICHQTTFENKPPKFISLLGSNFPYFLSHEMKLRFRWPNNGIKTCTNLKDIIKVS
jgi:hypothetical protein